MKATDSTAQRSAQEVPDIHPDPLQPWILELYAAALQTPVEDFPAWAAAMMRALPPGTPAAQTSLFMAHLREATRINARLHHAVVRDQAVREHAVVREHAAVRDASVPVGRALVDSRRRLVHWTEQFAVLLAGCSTVLRDGAVPRTWLRASSRRPIGTASIELRATHIGAHWTLRATPLPGCEQLTLRERAIASAFGDGKSYREVATDMGLSPAAVRNGLQRAYAKLGVCSKAELAGLAFLADT